MQDILRYLSVLLVALSILSFSLVRCEDTLPQTVDRPQRSLRNIDYINMCMFRKTRLCDFLREMENARMDNLREDRQSRKRAISQFYSNW